MSFNLRAKRKKSPMSELRSLDDDCANIRPSDLDGMSDDEMRRLVNLVPKTAMIRTAYHGDAGTFFPVSPDFNPYRTSPLVNNPGPQFGGRWRQDFPGSGDQHINDDSDKSKSLQGEAANDDFNPEIQKVRINDLMEKIKGPKYVVRMRLPEDQEPNTEKAKRMFGEDGMVDRKSIYVIVNGYEEAIRLQQKFPGCSVEPKK